MKIGGPPLEKDLEQFRQACQTAGVKCTPQRKLIFSELIGRTDHPDAEAVYQAVRKKNSRISMDTVYRSLWLFKELGLIQSLGTARERTRFDANGAPHHHFVCDRCGKTQDIHADDFDPIDIARVCRLKADTAPFRINVHGTCDDCTAMSSDQPR